MAAAACLAFHSTKTLTFVSRRLLWLSPDAPNRLGPSRVENLQGGAHKLKHISSFLFLAVIWRVRGFLSPLQTGFTDSLNDSS